MWYIRIQDTAYFHEVSVYREIDESLYHLLSSSGKRVFICIKLACVVARIEFRLWIHDGFNAHRAGLVINKHYAVLCLPYEVNASYDSLAVLFHAERTLMICLNRRTIGLSEVTLEVFPCGRYKAYVIEYISQTIRINDLLHLNLVRRTSLFYSCIYLVDAVAHNGHVRHSLRECDTHFEILDMGRIASTFNRTRQDIAWRKSVERMLFYIELHICSLIRHAVWLKSLHCLIVKREVSELMPIAEDIPSAFLRYVRLYGIHTLRDRPVKAFLSSLELLYVHDHHITGTCHSDIEDAVVLCDHRVIGMLEVVRCLDRIADHIRHIDHRAIDPWCKSDIYFRVRILG